MLKPRIIVTGATGKTGSVVVSELLKAGYPVRALVHREDGRRRATEGAGGRDRSRRQGSPARTHCRHDAMAGKPFASLAHDPSALARRSAVFGDSRSRA